MSWQEFRKNYEYNKKYHSAYHRNFEIDFILQYLPDMSTFKSNINVLDVGCCESLLLHELKKRNYDTYGLDMRDYNHPLPEGVTFFKEDIMNNLLFHRLPIMGFYYIVALSTIEHVGLDAYGGKIEKNGDRMALENIFSLLNNDGYFLITVPTKPFESKSGRGYSPREFSDLIKGLFYIFDITLGGGQICAALIKNIPQQIHQKP